MVGWVAVTGSVADGGDAHGRLGAEGGVEGTDEGGPGGGDEFLLGRGGVGGEAAEEVGGGGGGDGEAAVGAFHHASAYVEGRAVPAEGLAGFGEGLLVEVVDGGGGGDDVDDGVYGAYFVEVDLVDVYVMDAGFGGAEQLEGVDGGLSDLGWKGGGVDEGADGGEGAGFGVRVLMGGVWLGGLMGVLVGRGRG